MLLTGQPGADAQAAVDWVWGMVTQMAIPPLGEYGLTEAGIPEVVQAATRSSSMAGNPIELTEQEMDQVLRRAL
jgi:alcohol dehydrogenase class IV